MAGQHPEAAPPAELERLYQQYGALVFRRARRLLGDEQRAKDVCQEVFLRLWRYRPTFVEVAPVTWLYRVTTNLCLNQVRDERRRNDLGTRLGQGGDSEHPPSPELPAALLLRGVPEPLQAIAIYYYVDRMSQDEIAEVLGVAQRTVSNRLKQFRSVFAAGEDCPAMEVP
jgi:RNA polymerase sigma-70 factor (ECF subfamily)